MLHNYSLKLKSKHIVIYCKHYLTYRPLKMEYYSEKLFWKGVKQGELEVFDLSTKSLAKIQLTENDIEAFDIYHKGKLEFPGQFQIHYCLIFRILLYT